MLYKQHFNGLNVETYGKTELSIKPDIKETRKTMILSLPTFFVLQNNHFSYKYVVLT